MIIAMESISTGILDYAKIESESNKVFMVKIIHSIVKEDGEVTFLEFKPQELNPFRISAHVEIRYKNCVDDPKEPENEGIHPVGLPKIIPHRLRL